MEDLLRDDVGPALLKRQLKDTDLTCPAGRVVGDAGCFCSIEQGVIDGRTQTASITGFCMSGYEGCPTWQAEKQRISDTADWRKSLLDRPPVNRTPAALRQERLEMARERLAANTPEAKRFRRRIGLST